jgi:large subunit ribosomal protein L21
MSTSFQTTPKVPKRALTPLPEHDTLIKFGAAAHVSSFQGLQGRQALAGGQFQRLRWFGRFASMQCSCMRPMQHNLLEESGQRLYRATLEVLAMYAVIRTGGKQYLVSPGEQLKIETTAHENGKLEFCDVLAVSGEEGKFESDLTGAKVLASVVGEGRGDKILVFKLKRKKQYKKMQGHRQNFVEVKINEIFVNGKSFKEKAK